MPRNNPLHRSTLVFRLLNLFTFTYICWLFKRSPIQPPPGESDRYGTDGMQLWFVDDKRENHETWSNSFAEPLKQACELRSFYDIATLIDELDSGNIPDILFLDFFISERLGVDVIRWFEGKDDRPVLIAHSSMNAANEGMVTEGADFWLEKVKNRTHTDSIMRVFKTIEDITYIAKHRAIPQDR